MIRDNKQVGKEDFVMEKNLTAGIFGSVLLMLGVFFLASCGGGGGDAPIQLSSVPGFSAGTLTKGSVIVNGVKFDAAAGATVVIDDNPGTEAGLRDGMQAKVKGTMSSNGTTGVFDKVQAEPEVRGTMTGKGVDNFTVIGQPVIVDDLTKVEDCTAAGVCTARTFNDLADTNEVEVHGIRDDAGRVHATRVERHIEDTLDEVKGTVAAPIVAGTSFALANGATTITVVFTGATFSPAGKSAANLVAGALVEVHGGLNAFNAGTFTATKIDFDDAEFEALEGQHFEIEGLVSGLSGNNFKVGTMAVQMTGSTIFRGGIAADLANNIRVEVEGHKASGILQVEKVKFKDNIRIEADVTALTGTTAGNTLTVLGKTVKIATMTEINGALVGGAGVRVRGFASGSTITAIRIDVQSGTTNANANVIQGPISAVSGTSSMTMVGLTVNTTAVDVGGFRDINDASISAASFFSQLKTTAPATIVKAKGTFAGTTLTAKEVELEDPN